ncbi:MAG: RluA family pseudouridine synthase [Wujia sp.]
MVELQVSSQDAGQRLNKYLMKYLNQAPSSFIYKMLRKKNITLNGKKASGDEKLEEKDCIKLFLADDTIRQFREEIVVSVSSSSGKQTIECKVLYQDDDILVVHKPAGVLSQKAKQKDYSMNERILDYCLDEGLVTKQSLETFKPSVCNRLDRNTSGILLAGITLKGSQMLSEKLRERSCDKYYYTIVKGEMKQTLHEKAYIVKNTKTNQSVVTRTKPKTSDYRTIETEFIPVSVNRGYSLLKVKLYTGKSHQIRAHLQACGYAMLGDEKYGSHALNQVFKKEYKLSHHLLHAGEIRFSKEWVIKDPLPEIFISIAKALELTITDIM